MKLQNSIVWLFAILVFTGWVSSSRAQTETDPPKIPTDLTVEQIDRLIAPLSDAQTRDMLIRQLQRTARSEPPSAATSSADYILGLQRLAENLSSSVRKLAQSVSTIPAVGERMVRNLTDQQGWPAIFKALGVFAILVLAGLTVERLFHRGTTHLHARLAEHQIRGAAQRFALLLVRLFLGLISVVLFSVTAFAASYLFYDRFDPLRVFVTTYLSLIAVAWAAYLVSRFLFSPYNAGLRLLDMDDTDAKTLHRWVFTLIVIVGFGFFTNGLLTILGNSKELGQLFTLFFGTGVIGILIGLVWKYRQRVSAAMSEQGGDQRDAGGTLRVLFAQSWHWLAAVYLVIVGGVWAINIVLEREQGAQAAVNSLLLLLLLPLADRAVHGLLNWLFSIRATQNNLESGDQSRYAAVFQNVLRLIIISGALLILAEAWGFGVFNVLESSSGRVVAKALFNIGITLLLAYIAWQFIKIAIDRHLPAQDEEVKMSFEGEGGEAAPATRAETLLPLLRSSLFVVLVVLVAMLILAAAGVNIGPLLAGAGVVGLALGFGAQKLVQDVISGIFFLLDDAFRVGEFIEAGEMRGTVEKISMRSMRLRHYLGPVQTIPYGEIAAITNRSRDYIIMKLTFRVPYDTDIEKVRKIIKRTGQKLLKDENLGPMFLAPVKSQGVLEIEDSAMLMRMKFTAVPGEQWVLRREVYRHVRDALYAAGIEFAHRQVTVHVPKDADAKHVAAAGAASALAADQQGKPAQDPSEIQ